ncbi:MAG: DUF4783 domain-containing protein [Saprospiraceae bacterium]|nr:DUF4783 domain-containing protein [Saprospiraceae bacterium]
MKTVLISIFLLTALSISAQTEVDFLNSIGNGKMQNLESFLSSQINLSINDKQEKVERGIAIKKIKTFLKSKKIVKYKILHNGNSADNKSSYRVARLKTRTGTYRIFAYSEGLGRKSKVVEVRIDAM